MQSAQTEIVHFKQVNITTEARRIAASSDSALPNTSRSGSSTRRTTSLTWSPESRSSKGENIERRQRTEAPELSVQESSCDRLDGRKPLGRSEHEVEGSSRGPHRRDRRGNAAAGPVGSNLKARCLREKEAARGSGGNAELFDSLAHGQGPGFVMIATGPVSYFFYFTATRGEDGGRDGN